MASLKPNPSIVELPPRREAKVALCLPDSTIAAKEAPYHRRVLR